MKNFVETNMSIADFERVCRNRHQKVEDKNDMTKMCVQTSLHAFVIKDLGSIVNEYVYDKITVLVPIRAGFYKNVHILE